MNAALSLHPQRHAELVSASTAPQAWTGFVEGWTLKQVQGDGWIGAVAAQKLLGIWVEGCVG